MTSDIDFVTIELKKLWLPLSKAQVLPSNELFDSYEKELGFIFSEDYRYFLKEASDSLFNDDPEINLCERRVMILEISRGHVKVKIGDRAATLQGEMFFPGDDKIGFVLYKRDIKFWDTPDHNQAMTPGEIEMVIADIQADLSKGGHILEIDEQ